MLSDQDTTTNQVRERTRYNVKKTDWDSFKGQLSSDIQWYKPNGTIDQGAESIVEAISKAAKSSIPIKGTPRGKRLPPCWTPEMKISGREVNNYKKNYYYETTDRAGYMVVRSNHLSLIRSKRFNQ